MKLEPRRIEAFLRDPGSVRAVLLHGEDGGLVAERAGALVRAIAGSLDDPFRVVELDRSGISAIPAEVASLSISGGRRVVRVRDATDAAAGPVREALAGPVAGFLVLESGPLPASSKLRAVVERAPDAAAIGCYPQEGSDLASYIRDRLLEAGTPADDDAVTWLAGHLGGDRGVTRQEIQKLSLFAGQGGRVDLSAARASVGDLAGLSTDDALFFATEGNVPGTDRALGLALAEGGSSVGILRQALAHVQRLSRARAAIDAGASVSDAARAVRPPLFFRRQTAFSRALGLWSAPALSWAAARLSDAELACKSTGLPAETICKHAMIGVAQRAASLRRR